MSNFTYLNSNDSTVSTDSGSPVRFSIHNDSTEFLTLYWVDRTGKQTAYMGLNQNDTYNQDSVTTHVWVLKSDDGKVNIKFEPSFAGKLTIGTDLQSSFADFSEHVTQTTNGLWSSAQGYGLIDVAKSLGVSGVADLAVNGQNNNLALNAINAPAAWAAGITGKGVKVAVIDIGIAANSEINSKIVAQYDFYSKDSDASPDAGTYKDHALGVASIIAASHDVHSGRDTMGVAPDASLINVRVGSSQYGSNSADMASGIRYAVDQGAKVICMPLESQSTHIDQQVADAVHYAYQHNVVTVIIGGNYSNYGATGPALIAQQLKGEVIDVGNYNVMSGSAFDSSNMPGDTPMPWVMASSSGYVPNSNGGYTYWGDGGTSFAGPYVAGLAALLWQQNPNANATDIINKIVAGASIGENATTALLPQTVMGTDHADTLKLVASAAINGGAGVDTLQVSGLAANYVVTATSAGFTLTNQTDNSVNTLQSVERIQFTDKAVALDIIGNGGEVYRLYQAAFNRAPDKGGLGFWMGAMDNGKSLSDVASGFVNSDEFHKLYGTNPTNDQLVNAMYQNVLHRAPEKTGLDFWVSALEHGTTTTQLLTSFSDSAENIATMAKIIGQGFEYTPIHG
jgi:subtilisin family serine protease